MNGPQNGFQAPKVPWPPLPPAGFGMDFKTYMVGNKGVQETRAAAPSQTLQSQSAEGFFSWRGWCECLFQFYFSML